MTTRREHSGNASRTELTAGIDDNDTTIAIQDATSWPTGSVGPFVVTIGRGTGSEERVLITSRSGSNLTVAQRGFDGTAATSHLSGADIEHTISAEEFDSFNFDLSIPAAPTNLVLANVSDTITITFTKSTSLFVTEYEVWITETPGSNYRVTRIPVAQVTGATYTLIDAGFRSTATMEILVYAVNHGSRSSALSGSIASNYSVPDPSSIEVTAESTCFIIKVAIPSHRMLDYVRVRKAANSLANTVTEGGSTEVGQIKGEYFVYQIPTLDLAKYHKFWVNSVTRSTP